jgi:hypothetical protein
MPLLPPGDHSKKSVATVRETSPRPAASARRPGSDARTGMVAAGARVGMLTGIRVRSVQRACPTERQAGGPLDAFSYEVADEMR